MFFVRFCSAKVDALGVSCEHGVRTFWCWCVKCRCRWRCWLSVLVSVLVLVLVLVLFSVLLMSVSVVAVAGTEQCCHTRAAFTVGLDYWNSFFICFATSTFIRVVGSDVCFEPLSQLGLPGAIFRPLHPGGGGLLLGGSSGLRAPQPQPRGRYSRSCKRRQDHVFPNARA